MKKQLIAFFMMSSVFTTFSSRADKGEGHGGTGRNTPESICPEKPNGERISLAMGVIGGHGGDGRTAGPDRGTIGGNGKNVDSKTGKGGGGN